MKDSQKSILIKLILILVMAAVAYAGFALRSRQISERDFILKRSQYLRELAMFKTWRQHCGITKYEVILNYFISDPKRILGVVRSRIGYIRYSISRLRAGGRRR